MPNSNQINNLSPNFRDLLLNMNLPLRDTVVDNSLTTYLNGVVIAYHIMQKLQGIPMKK